MPYDDALLEKYRKIVTLSIAGSAGEKESAMAKAKAMDEKYPGIYAEAYPKKANIPNIDWNQLLNQTFNWASQAASRLADLGYAQQLAEELTDIEVKYLAKSGRMTIGYKFDADEFEMAAITMSQVQREVFVRMLAEKFALKLEETLLVAANPEEDDDDEDDEDE